MTRARWLVAAVVLLATVFALQAGEYSTLDWLELRRLERAESLQVAELERTVDSLTTVAEAVETDPRTQERIAREKYGMARDGEIVYQIVPDGDTAATDAP